MDWKAKKGDERREALIQREAKKGGFRGKINAKCIECIYDPLSIGNWRKQVEKCTSLTCPLYSVRPTSSVEVD
jgi:hypothetical protein